MDKKLTFTYDDKDYVLEYTKNTVRQMERSGFIANDLEDKPMTVLPTLFAGAFLANHSSVKREKIDIIYSKMGDKKRLIAALSEMYNDTVETLLEEPEEGNVEWTQNWQDED